jgi:Cu-Zn family superoxide dismutase
MNRRFKNAVLAGASALAIGGAALSVVPVNAASAPGDEARAPLFDTTGVQRGTVTFREADGRVQIHVRVEGATAGFHGFHVHSTGTCRNPDGTPNFALAGGHYGHDPAGGVVHGNHPGDLPPLYVDASGNGRASFGSDRFSIPDIANRAVIVHAGPDNMANIPARYGVVLDDTTLGTGDAGARSYCGVIKQL